MSLHKYYIGKIAAKNHLISNYPLRFINAAMRFVHLDGLESMIPSDYSPKIRTNRVTKLKSAASKSYAVRSHLFLRMKPKKNVFFCRSMSTMKQKKLAGVSSTMEDKATKVAPKSKTKNETSYKMFGNSKYLRNTHTPDNGQSQSTRGYNRIDYGMAKRVSQEIKKDLMPVNTAINHMLANMTVAEIDPQDNYMRLDSISKVGLSPIKYKNFIAEKKIKLQLKSATPEEQHTFYRSTYGISETQNKKTSKQSAFTSNPSQMKNENDTDFSTSFLTEQEETKYKSYPRFVSLEPVAPPRRFDDMHIFKKFEPNPLSASHQAILDQHEWIAEMKKKPVVAPTEDINFKPLKFKKPSENQKTRHSQNESKDLTQESQTHQHKLDMHHGCQARNTRQKDVFAKYLPKAHSEEFIKNKIAFSRFKPPNLNLVPATARPTDEYSGRQNKFPSKNIKKQKRNRSYASNNIKNYNMSETQPSKQQRSVGEKTESPSITINEEAETIPPSELTWCYDDQFCNNLPTIQSKSLQKNQEFDQSMQSQMEVRTSPPVKRKESPKKQSSPTRNKDFYQSNIWNKSAEQSKIQQVLHGKVTQTNASNCSDNERYVNFGVEPIPQTKPLKQYPNYDLKTDTDLPMSKVASYFIDYDSNVKKTYSQNTVPTNEDNINYGLADENNDLSPEKSRVTSGKKPVCGNFFLPSLGRISQKDIQRAANKTDTVSQQNWSSDPEMTMYYETNATHSFSRKRAENDIQDDNEENIEELDDATEAGEDDQNQSRHWHSKY